MPPGHHIPHPGTTSHRSPGTAPHPIPGVPPRKVPCAACWDSRHGSARTHALSLLLSRWLASAAGVLPSFPSKSHSFLPLPPSLSPRFLGRQTLPLLSLNSSICRHSQPRLFHSTFAAPASYSASPRLAPRHSHPHAPPRGRALDVVSLAVLTDVINIGWLGTDLTAAIDAALHQNNKTDRQTHSPLVASIPELSLPAHDERPLRHTRLTTVRGNQHTSQRTNDRPTLPTRSCPAPMQ